MSHNDHGNCGDEHHHHDHDHAPESANSDNLYSYIDHPNVRILNAADDAKVLKPWDQRLDESVYLQSDADDQLIIRVPFTGSVKLRSVLIKAGPGGQTPSKVALFANEDTLDFNDVADRKATHEFAIVQSREIGDYAVKPARFSNLSSVTLFFSASQGAETIQIYYLGFLGSFSQRKEAPSVIIYEAQANPATAEKIPGIKDDFGVDQIGYGGA
ncbi:galactose-binding domain-like protein [Gautieria morchelliformis]|nr:galactose-binding domain-like protein [Gautieria morchelliformis]